MNREDLNKLLNEKQKENKIWKRKATIFMIGGFFNLAAIYSLIVEKDKLLAFRMAEFNLMLAVALSMGFTTLFLVKKDKTYQKPLNYVMGFSFLFYIALLLIKNQIVS